ncbi:MAG: TlyA family RNA methyltransferase [Clostridiales bacterium]|jgi:23S rRNA (cytidine1920-2'-O)/16S rRNA (cytidine1409-2'-O)-methyltransferase|nr:TlyA family RNA methyltransferase [Clostridiales bacterium]
MGSERKRIDLLLTDKGLFPTRSAARAAVMAGLVTVDGRKVDKPGTMATEEAQIHVKELPRYVSRGGLKLEKALRQFSIHVTGKIVMDIGASTGGFTDCLLQAGAARVYSIDVGYGQLDWKLRQDERVVSMERTNVRHLEPDQIPEPVDLAVVDVSFISLALIFPVLVRFGVPEVVALVKPQFEVGKGRVGKKGVVRDPDDHLEVLLNAIRVAEHEGFTAIDLSYSPLRGPEGNIEYLLHLRTGEEITDVPAPDCAAIVAEAHSTLT